MKTSFNFKVVAIRTRVLVSYIQNEMLTGNEMFAITIRDSKKDGKLRTNLIDKTFSLVCVCDTDCTLQDIVYVGGEYLNGSTTHFGTY